MALNLTEKRIVWPVSIITGLTIRDKNGDGMMRIFVAIMVTVMMISECGAVKNFENPGLADIAKPSFGGNTPVPAEDKFWAKYGEDICVVSLIAVIIGALSIYNYAKDLKEKAFNPVVINAVQDDTQRGVL